MGSPDAFAGLQPTGLWAHFDQITHIPRPSGHEAAIARYIETWAERHGFPARGDAAGNLVIQVPGMAGPPPLALQAHLDMVCAREEGAPSDPARGVIRVIRDGDWIKAEGSTLGADNGIAIAAMLHLAETSDPRRAPLDLLFTVQEETTSGGADGLDPSLVRAGTLLNLDSEEEGVVVAGSAGGIWTKLRWSAPARPVGERWNTAEVTISGLRGGHSGIEIDKHRLNAIDGLLRVLQSAADAVPLSVCTLEGGDAFNAIPRQARAVVSYPSEADPRFEAAVSAARAEFGDATLGTEPGLALKIAVPSAAHPLAYSPEDSRKLIDMLRVVPDGVLAMDRHVPGLVETSNNLGLVTHDGDEIMADSFVRSSVTPAMHAVVVAIAAAARLGGAEFSIVPPEGPAWELDPGSPALALVREAYRRLFGKEPALRAVHAFLECSLIKKQIPMLDIVSIGPEIQGAHQPGERVHIGSVERFSRLLAEIARDFAAGSAGPAR